MEDHNSRAEYYSAMFLDLYADLADSLSVPVGEFVRDVSKVTSRMMQEGLPFFTITLPRIGKAFDKALSSGKPFVCPYLSKRRGSQLPNLFGWLLQQVFTDAGLERGDSNPSAVVAVRQLVYFLYKLEIPYNESRKQEVLDAFVATERQLDVLVLPEDECIKRASEFISDVFCTLDPAEIRPRHGPGTVATGETSAEKHKFRRIYTNIEAVYPFTEYYCFSLMHVCDSLREISNLEVLESGTTKVILVPKDSRGPRLISCEPLEYQWIQQGLGRAIMAHLENHRYTRGHVNFRDQEINRRLALESSKNSQWVTLDMKEASDRVGVDLVKRLFRHVPRLLEALLATRSEYTQLPSGSTMRLTKFAPMGSALCFPVEALCFYALAVGAIIQGTGMTRRDARKVVYVYGDDIIVHASVYRHVLQQLPSYGLMFNEDKCCTEGFFRESCGCDAYKGIDVTPIKLRSVWCHRRYVDPSTIASYVALSNAAYKNGWFRLVNRIEQFIGKTQYRIPVVNTDNPSCIAYIRDQCTQVQPRGIKTRFNKRLQRREVWACQVGTRFVKTSPDNWSTVLRRISAPDEYTQPGVYAVPHRSYPKWGWMPID